MSELTKAEKKLGRKLRQAVGDDYSRFRQVQDMEVTPPPPEYFTSQKLPFDVFEKMYLKRKRMRTLRIAASIITAIVATGVGLWIALEPNTADRAPLEQVRNEYNNGVVELTPRGERFGDGPVSTLWSEDTDRLDKVMTDYPGLQVPDPGEGYELTGYSTVKYYDHWEFTFVFVDADGEKVEITEVGEYEKVE